MKNDIKQRKKRLIDVARGDKLILDDGKPHAVSRIAHGKPWAGMVTVWFFDGGIDFAPSGLVVNMAAK